VTLHVLPDAEREAIEAAAWYEDKQPALGARFLDEVQLAIDLVRQDAQSLPRMEQYSGDFDVRTQRLKRFPYVLVVQCEPEATLVVAIAHSRRKPLYWTSRLN